ncbi:MAG TPA: Ig-like domain-containing protein, partial [Gemmatimonadales bacterium]|nr:Ig-like domain-containing protein [Gemmatimonadales bacterium]
PIIWHSDDDSVATVSLEGVLVARSGGSTRITAELDEARSTVAITVAPSPVAALHISPPPETVVSGESFALTATPLDRWAGPLTGRTISWTVSDVGVAVVTAGGWVITRNPGLVVLTATCENATASVSVNVVAKKAESVPAEGLDRPVRPAGRPQSEPWETVPEPRPSPEPQRRRSRPAWVIGAGGAAMIAAGLWLVGGRRPQSDPAPLTETAAAPRESAAGEPVSSNESGIKSGALPPGATADSSSPASITIVQRPATPLQLGTTADLVAEVRDVHGDILGGHPISWSSTDSAVASVDSASGTVRAIGPGRAQIVATAGTRQDTARIVVHAGGKQPVRAPGPTVEPVSLTMAPHDPIRVGDTTTLVVAAVNGAGKPLRRVRVTWSSSEPRVADVDAAGRVRAYSPGSTLIIARSGSESAMGPLTVLPASVASVNITGAQPLKVGDTLTLRAEAQDQRGTSLSGRPVAWTSGNPDVAPVDSASGVVVAQQAGSAEITATVEGKSGTAKITILPQPRTGRSEPPPPTQAPPRVVASANDAAREHQKVLEQMVAGVEQCYQALHNKDVLRVQALYNPADKADEDRLKKLNRILSTHEWDAQVGERQDGAQKVGDNTARMDFSFRLTWKDAFGGRLSSDPAFRAEFSILGSQLTLSSCRIINSPKL